MRRLVGLLLLIALGFFDHSNASAPRNDWPAENYQPGRQRVHKNQWTKGRFVDKPSRRPNLLVEEEIAKDAIYRFQARGEDEERNDRSDFRQKISNIDDNSRGDRSKGILVKDSREDASADSRAVVDDAVKSLLSEFTQLSVSPPLGCPSTSKYATLFVANDVLHRNDRYGALEPAKGSCKPCAFGVQNAYEGIDKLGYKLSDVERSDVDSSAPALSIQGELFCRNVEDICVETVDRQLYYGVPDRRPASESEHTPANLYLKLIAIPFCGNSTVCHVLAGIDANGTDAGLRAVFGTDFRSQNMEPVGDEDDYDLPAFDGNNYLKIVAVSCSGCRGHKQLKRCDGEQRTEKLTPTKNRLFNEIYQGRLKRPMDYEKSELPYTEQEQCENDGLNRGNCPAKSHSIGQCPSTDRYASFFIDATVKRTTEFYWPLSSAIGSCEDCVYGEQTAHVGINLLGHTMNEVESKTIDPNAAALTIGGELSCANPDDLCVESRDGRLWYGVGDADWDQPYLDLVAVPWCFNATTKHGNYCTALIGIDAAFSKGGLRAVSDRDAPDTWRGENYVVHSTETDWDLPDPSNHSYLEAVGVSCDGCRGRKAIYRCDSRTAPLPQKLNARFNAIYDGSAPRKHIPPPDSSVVDVSGSGSSETIRLDPSNPWYNRCPSTSRYAVFFVGKGVRRATNQYPPQKQAPGSCRTCEFGDQFAYRGVNRLGNYSMGDIESLSRNPKAPALVAAGELTCSRVEDLCIQTNTGRLYHGESDPAQNGSYLEIMPVPWCFDGSATCTILAGIDTNFSTTTGLRSVDGRDWRSDNYVKPTSAGRTNGDGDVDLPEPKGHNYLQIVAISCDGCRGRKHIKRCDPSTQRLSETANHFFNEAYGASEYVVLQKKQDVLPPPPPPAKTQRRTLYSRREEWKSKAVQRHRTEEEVSKRTSAESSQEGREGAIDTASIELHVSTVERKRKNKNGKRAGRREH